MERHARGRRILRVLNDAFAAHVVDRAQPLGTVAVAARQNDAVARFALRDRRSHTIAEDVRQQSHATRSGVKNNQHRCRQIVRQLANEFAKNVRSPSTGGDDHDDVANDCIHMATTDDGRFSSGDLQVASAFPWQPSRPHPAAGFISP